MAPHFDLLSRLFRSASSSTHRAQAPARATPGFTSDMSKADRSAWSAQAACAIDVTRRLDDHSTQAGLASKEMKPPRCAASAPELPVNKATLLERAAVPDRLVGQLHANQLHNGHLLMSIPGTSESFAWADACQRHDVRIVLDLGTSRSADVACMHAGKPIVSSSGWEVRFDPRMRRFGRGREQSPGDIGGQATQSEMSIRQLHEGKEVGTPQELSWIRVPVDDQRAISPRLLLNTCRHLDRERSAWGPDSRMAFQCPQGDHRSAVFAAAHQLFDRCQSGNLRAGGLADAVFEECAKVRSHRSQTLFNEHHVTSLLAFGGMLLEEQRSRRSKGDGTPPPVHARNPPPGREAPVRSALRRTEPGDPQVRKAPERRVAFNAVVQFNDGSTTGTKPGDAADD